MPVFTSHHTLNLSLTALALSVFTLQRSLSLSLSLSVCLHSATHGTNARRGHSRATQQHTAAAAQQRTAAHGSSGQRTAAAAQQGHEQRTAVGHDLVGQRRATRIRGTATAEGGPARAAGKRRRPHYLDLRGIFRIPVSHPSRSRESSHGCHNNEKRGTGTY